MTALLHLTERALWDAALASGTYEMSTRGRTLQEEGFIHTSLRHQVVAVAGFLYDGWTGPGDLVLLTIDSDRLTAPLRYEPPAPGADDFPHIYGPIPVDAVVKVQPWQGGYVLDWSEANWLNPPVAAERDGDDLLVTAADKTDFWRTTSYGFVHDDGHALLTDFPAGSAVEVTFDSAAFTDLYDQAGIMVRVDEADWIKAGIELTDSAPHLGAVVTHGRSDWSMAPVPDWSGRSVTVRASRAGDAVTVRARCEDGPWRMVRVAPLDPDATAAAGPFCCSPLREGLQVRFTRFAVGPADTELHADPAPISARPR
jgi:regulation of enolase protein 1 (concanavalin A-like superfamily)/uncharacterized protein (DUF952 family)